MLTRTSSSPAVPRSWARNGARGPRASAAGVLHCHEIDAESTLAPDNTQVLPRAVLQNMLQPCSDQPSSTPMPTLRLSPIQKSRLSSTPWLSRTPEALSS
ncbi:hypothetical protein PsYK624_062410 [Phanerochaete sordida]|uniref:Uncharacterized protein n=1 Tax=Phanerochaete sordida TaxID=48140 RepID=A0A9P3LDA0_9APHY|nr:hypothetical protein PsYK624_062410 [Phanerochaete sordida]